MDISITLNEQQQELLLSQARVQGIFDLDDDLWAEIAAKIAAARSEEEPWYKKE
jgi:hypothetical protein